MVVDRPPSLRQLRAFVAVCRLQKLSSAAEQLAITPGAVSVLLRQLEEAIGVVLFDRASGRLRPTTAALDALPIAERALADASLFGSTIREWQSHRRGTVRLAITPALGAALMPGILKGFLRVHPEVRVVIDDCPPEKFLDRLLSGQVELGIGTPESLSAELEMTPLLEDELCVLCPKPHALASQQSVRWKQLAGQPVILIRGGYGVRRLIDASANRAGVVLEVVNEVSFLPTVLWMVSSGLGISILPRALARASSDPYLVTRTLTHPTVQRSVSLVRNRGLQLSPACEEFVRVAQETVHTGKHARML